MLTQHSVSRLRTVTSPRLPAEPLPAVPGVFGSVDLLGLPIHYRRNAEIFGESEPAEYLYEVVRGAVRACRILADGRRQVCAFYLPGEVFGLEVTKRYHHSAEAICDSSIQLIRRSTLLRLAARDAHVAGALWTLTARELERMQDHALLLVRSAPERVACFLLEMAERLTTAEVVELPMSRNDIADYLGLTIETISRTLAQFADEAMIALPRSRRVLLRNRKALRQLNA
jgi:CRP/FNR family transcriptional regulator, nitrogen fixation regulation protein